MFRTPFAASAGRRANLQRGGADMSRCFSIHPQLLPRAADAIWFASPVVDEEAQLAAEEQAWEAQVRVAVACENPL